MLLAILLVLQILVSASLIGVILLQQSDGGALGMGGGPSGFMTARGAGDLLTRTTGILAAVFFGLCLLLTVLSAHAKGGSSVVDRLKVDALNPAALTKPQPQTQAPAASRPAAPTTGSGFEAPQPEVNTAPAGAAFAPPPPIGTTPAAAPAKTAPKGQ